MSYRARSCSLQGAVLALDGSKNLLFFSRTAKRQNECKSENQPAPETATTPCRTRGERSNLAEHNGGRTSSVVSVCASAANSDMIGVCALLCWKPLPGVSCTGRCALPRINAIFRSVLPSALPPPLLQMSSRSTRFSSASKVRALSCVSNQPRRYLQAALGLECVLPLERLSPPQISRIRVFHEVSLHVCTGGDWANGLRRDSIFRRAPQEFGDLHQDKSKTREIWEGHNSDIRASCLR